MAGDIFPAKRFLGNQNRHLSVLLAILVFLASSIIVYQAIRWTLVAIDDYRYGRPRMARLEVDLNPTDKSTQPTVIIGLNIERQVTVLSIGGPDPANIQVLKGPYLFGADEHLTPVRLRLANVNSDPYPDLVVSLKREELLYISENSSFRLITEAERAAYVSR